MVTTRREGEQRYGWRIASRWVRFALLMVAAAANVAAADDLLTDLVPDARILSEVGGNVTLHHGGQLRLWLAWCDVLHRTPFPFEPMSAEVKRILGGESVDVAWLPVGCDGVLFDQSVVKVILLDGPRSRPAQDRHVMGMTHRDETSRAVWAFSDNVLWALGLGREPLLSPPQQQEFGRALGRVVAHELVHAIAPDVAHARKGLMRPSMDRAALLAPGLGLESAQRRAFEAQLASFSGDRAQLGSAAVAAVPPPALP
jgi:hypothetical protein